MNRNQLIEYIRTTYSVDGDCPWAKTPEAIVFRHNSNKKWFALVMTVRKSCINSDGEGFIDILNLKCDKTILGSALENSGFYPAYHMNKENWITIALDGSADDEKLKFFLDMSFELTLPKIKQT